MDSSNTVLVPQELPWKEVLPEISAAPRLSFDLEGDFDLHRYGKRICLFQIGLDSGRIFLVDPLPSESFPGLKEILENPSQPKIIWGAQNDVRVLKHCWQSSPQGVADLWEAARLCLSPRPSLPFLVDHFLHRIIEKKEELQTSDWNLRPLTSSQVEYAAQDVVFLLQLWDGLSELLTRRNLEGTFRERMLALEALTFKQTTTPWTKIRGAGALLPAQLELLKVLYLERDVEAKRVDVAPWKLIRNENLVEMAKGTVERTVISADSNREVNQNLMKEVKRNG